MAGNDRIIYKGKIYGNTVNTDNAIIAIAPDKIDEDGTELYILQNPEEVETVEIKNGGRVTYGTSDLQTVICQGIKMTWNQGGNSPIQDAFLKGFLKPTDLYTSFNLDPGFWAKPTYNQPNHSYEKGVAKGYNLMPVYYNGSSNKVYYCFIVDNSEYSERTNPCGTIDTGNTSISFGEATATIFYTYDNQKFPRTFETTTAAGRYVSKSTNLSKEYYEDFGLAKYIGVYFVVNGVYRTGVPESEEETVNQLYCWDENNDEYAPSKVDGYIKMTPYIIGLNLSEQNHFPTFFIDENYQLPSGGTITAQEGDIISIKSNNKRNFYTCKKYEVDEQTKYKFIQFNYSDIKGHEIRYLGDVNTVPTSASEISITTTFSDTIEDIYKDMLGLEHITFNYDYTQSKQGDFNIANDIDNHFIRMLVIGSGTLVYTEQKTNEFRCYSLVAYHKMPSFPTGDTKDNIICPFGNNAELEFALGVREKLKYVGFSEDDSND